MELARQNRIRFHITQIVLQLQVPLVVRLMFGLLLGVTVVVAGVVVCTQYESAPANPFQDFSDLLNDDIQQAALAHGFTCAGSVANHASPIPIYCATQLPDGLFSQVYLGLSGSYGNEISFTVRENGLRIGDLAARWGEPELWGTNEFLAADWPDNNATAIVLRPRAAHFSYFLPVLYVSFTRRDTPHGSLLYGMEKLPDAAIGDL